MRRTLRTAREKMSSMTSIDIEKPISLILLLLVIATIIYPALPVSLVSVEIEAKPLTEANSLELRIEELSLHHYGARKYNGKIPIIKEEILKTFKGRSIPYRYVTRIPSGAYDQLIIKFSDAKAYIDDEEIQPDISQKTVEKNVTILLEENSHLKISLQIDEGEFITNRTISINVEVNALNQ